MPSKARDGASPGPRQGTGYNAHVRTLPPSMVRRVAVIHVAALLHMYLRTCARAPPPPQPPPRIQSQSSLFFAGNPNF